MSVTLRTPRNVQSPYTTADLMAHIAGPANPRTLCCCWKLTPVNSNVSPLGFTNNTRDLTLPGHGITFVSRRGLMPTTGEQSEGLATPNIETDAIFESSGISSQSVDAGVWDFAMVEVFLVNYKAVGMGELLWTYGRIGQITSEGKRFRAEALGLNGATSQQVVELTTPTCRARDLGDYRCQLDVAPFTFTTAISGTPPNNRTLTLAMTPQADGYFDNGKITFTSGQNIGVSMEVKTYVSNVITLKLPAPFTMAAGNTLTIIAGCDRLAATCETKFNNKINFQGEDTVPGIEALNRVPSVA
jgi:uncharacterized phage protein (TIGR02218 family)